MCRFRANILHQTGVMLTVILIILMKTVCLMGNGSQVNEFCYVNNFKNSTTIKFRMISPTLVDHVNNLFIDQQLQTGSPFMVSGVTKSWKAVEKWSHSYFEKLFKNENLFSSTFSTPKRPEFCSMEDCSKDVYYGIFLNNQLLAESLSSDYEYPQFLPNEWWIKGKCFFTVISLFLHSH